jgi:hypothetical protein
VHLFLLGFTDEITNFTLTLNNPSNQIEAVELENLTKRIAAATSALAEQGCGIPLMSWHQVQKEIMGKTDEEISTILNEIRVEAALANEIQMTTQIIEKTGLFDKADRLYGKPGAKYQQAQGGEEGGLGGGGGGGMPMGGGMDLGGDFGGDLDGLGEPGTEDMGDIGGEEGSMDLESAPLNEQINNIVNGYAKTQFFDLYNKFLTKETKTYPERPKIINNNIIINETLTSTIEKLSELVNKNSELDKLLDE